MRHSGDKEKIAVHEQNISYYDEIADSYDGLLERDDSNKLIRENVREKFLNHVRSGWVLDFGGGTGLDLGWLTANNCHIIFCEPSVAMREKAIRYNNSILHNKNIIFLDTAKTDFTRWCNENPFPRQVDAILANFGVINNIQDIELLFENLALVIKPGGHFIAIFLERSFKNMLKWHRRNAIRSLIFRTPFIMYVSHKGHKQTVFVHALKEIKKACKPYFNYYGSESLGGFGFMFIHLVRNEKPH